MVYLYADAQIVHPSYSIDMQFTTIIVPTQVDGSAA